MGGSLLTKLLITAVALAAYCGCGVAAAQTVEFRVVEREGQSAIISSADAELNMSVQARIVGGAPGTALSGFFFDILVRDEPDSFGTLAKGLISNLDGSYATTIDISGSVGRGGLARQFTYFAGINGNFNGVINVSAGTFTNTPVQEIGLITGVTAAGALLGVPGLDVDQNGVPDTYPGSGNTAPLDPAIGATYFGVGGDWIDVYRFRYTVTNLTSRTLQLDLGASSAETFTTLAVSNGVWGIPNGVTRATSVVPTTVTIAVSDIGACCDGSGMCTTSSGAACVGSFFVGASCTPIPCFPTGSCCFNTGACSVSTLPACTAVWMQDGTCTPNVCTQPGACCTVSEVCALLLQSSCHQATWIAGGTCSPNSCAQPGACCRTDCQFVSQHSCTSGTWMQGTCTPNPCPPPTACCNATTGACSLVLSTGDIVYNYSYSKGLSGYARNDSGGTVETITATFNLMTKRLVFDAYFSGATSGGPLITSGFWLVLDNGPNPKAHPGELAIFYFDAATLASPALTVYAYNGADANTSWSDGDPGTAGDQPGDLIKGLYETSYINALVVENTTVGGQPRRHLKFDIDATDIMSHVPLYPAASPWYGAGFDIAMGLWFHGVGGFTAAYESNTGGHRGTITSLATTDEGWLDAAARPITDNDPCPFGSRITPAAACTPTNTCPQRKACCDATNGLCVVVGPSDDCPSNFTFASPAASTCSSDPCPSLALQAGGTCCNTVTGACYAMPLSCCAVSTHTWHAGGACSTNPCPPRQGACCNVVTGTCAVSSQSVCAPAAHDWLAGSTCSSDTCAAPGVCCNTAAGTCRRCTQSRCSTGGPWAPTGACSPNPCALTGPCCNVVTGTCQLTLQSACAPLGHDWMPGATCSPNACAAPGACCNLETGACRRFTWARCSTGGIWTAGACSPNPCTFPGPCCNVVTGTCQLTLGAACAPLGHDWMPGGEGACSPNVCAAPGACCNLATGACRRFTPARCPTGSIWIASGVCSPDPCSLPQGACCNVVVGTCAVSRQSDCAPAAHAWFAGAACSPNACVLSAACCNALTGICRRLTEVRCMAANSEWLTGQTCTPNPCSASLVATCPADFNHSGQVNVQDVLAFLSAWFVIDPSADISDDGEIDAADIFDFLTAWFAGC
jgi:hypothetical protein